MKISILTPDLSHNCLGRAYILAKVLQRRYDVEIIGPVFGNEIWRPVADDKDVVYKFVKFGKRFISVWKLKELYKKIDGDIIYAVKPLFTSFGLGLIKKINSRRPLILDIDDWQMGFINDYYHSLSIIKRLRYFIGSFVCPCSTSSYWNNLFGEKLSRLADSITVSNSFLKEKFDGVIVWHGRDTSALNPIKFDKFLLRQKYGIDKESKIVMFFGTPRPHKGVEDLVKAVNLIKNKDVVLIIVGVDNRDQYCKNLVKTARKILVGKLKIFGLQSFKKVPEFLSIADVIVIPQRRSYSTVGQIPAKVFDAMAMAKPIIATNVSDLPEILNGCGWIVEAGNPEQLSRMIQYVMDNPEKAIEIGWKARQKCIERYSWDVMEKALAGVFTKIVDK